MTAALLVGDVGGTNARLALSDRPGHVRDVESFRVADFASCEDAIAAYLAARPNEKINGAAIAAAGPVDEAGAVELTNATWRLTPSGLAVAIGGGPARVLNDLEAVALALPHLTRADYRDLGPTIADPLTGNLLALNVGTGLGAATAIEVDGKWIANATEAGHMSFAARNAQEIHLLEHLLSYEDILSGPGASHLYARVSDWHGEDAPPRSDPDIFARAANNPIAKQAAQVFTGVLARVAGDLVLATGAWGGVYLTGSVISAWASDADPQNFREAFSAKGKMALRMQHVPTRLITSLEPALTGLSYARPKSALAP